MERLPPALLAVLLFLFSTPAPAQTTHPPVWMRITEMYVNVGPPRQYFGPVFVNSATPAGPSPDVWTGVDLTAPPWNLSPDAIAADLRGLVIITSGVTPGIVNIGVIFRKVGDNSVTCATSNYMGQTVFQVHKVEKQIVSGGQRSNMATWVPLVDGKVEFCWTRSAQPAYPEGPALGVNLSVQAWAKGVPAR